MDFYEECRILSLILDSIELVPYNEYNIQKIIYTDKTVEFQGELIMPECRYCGNWYRSNKGLNLHITKMHTSEGPFGNRMVDVGTIDTIGAMEKRRRRLNNRRKKGGMFNFP